MRDSKIDLCGQIGFEEEDDFPSIAQGQSFSFSCNGCGDCCRGREDIVLSGYDLYRIAVRLRLPPRIVAEGFCRQYIGTKSRLPVLRLSPLQKERNNCPFLVKNHCAIHDAEPLVCALYPLGQQIDSDGTIQYFIQPIDCGGTVIEAKLDDFLGLYRIREREKIDVQWAHTCIELSGRMKSLEKELEPILLRRLEEKILSALYYDYSYEEDYEQQRDANLARLDREIEKLKKMQIRRKNNG